MSTPSMDDLFGNRASGRTYRMLERAKAAAASGKRVLVVCATARHAQDLRKELVNECNIEVRCVGSGPIRGARHHVFVDHYVYELMITEFNHAWGVEP